jgi:hypothetical protein
MEDGVRMADKVYGQLKDFSAGLNTKDSPSLALEQELVDVENAVLGRGFVQKRSGYENFSVAPTQNTLYTWDKLGGKKWSEV